MAPGPISIQTDGGKILSAEIVDLDPAADAALVRTEEPLKAPAIPMAPTVAEQGSAMALIGYPLGTYELRISEGIVSGREGPISFGTQEVKRVFVTDAATNGGNSGGPAVDSDGEVIGLVSGSRNWSGSGVYLAPVQGTNDIIPVDDLSPRLARWRTQPATDFQTCPGDGQQLFDGVLDIDVQSRHPDAADIGQSLSTHGQSINAGAYEAAWRVFTARQQRRMRSYDEWVAGVGTTSWESLVVQKVSRAANTAIATTVLLTRQSADRGPRPGEKCTVWLLDYRMVLTNGTWLIDKALERRPSTLCEAE